MTSVLVAPDPRGGLFELFREGRFAEALRCYRDHDLSGLRSPEADLVAATAAARVGEYDTGGRLAVTALGGFADRDDAGGRLRTLNLLGGIAFERGRLEEADRHYHEAARLARRLDDQAATARAWNNLATIAHLRERADAALEFFGSALTVYERMSDLRGAAQVHHNLALVLREQGRLERAERHAALAMRLAEQSSDPPLLALVLMGRAELALARHQLAAAGRDIGAARRLAELASDRYGVAEGHRLHAMVSLRLGLLDTARDHAVRGWNLAREVGAGILAAECLALSAMALRALGDPEEAESRYQTAVRELEEERALRVLRRVKKGWNPDA